MRNKHTDGPWIFDSFDRGCIIDGEGIFIAELSNEDEEGFIEEDPERHMANGELIAAAPELLEILEKIINRLDFTSKDTDEARRIIRRVAAE